MGVVSLAWAEKFTIAVIPDTQSYPTNEVSMAGFFAETQYIADNKLSRNIVFATHLGDMVWNFWPVEWERAQSAMNVLRDSGIPLGIAIGNHDYDFGSVNYEYCTFTNWTRYFGPESSYFQGKSWYHRCEGNPADSFQIFRAAGRDFLHIVLDHEAGTNSLQWANQVVLAHTGMPTIVSTHEYLHYNGYRTGYGQRIWNNLVKGNSQIFMVLCGHLFPCWTCAGETNIVSTNAAGKLVYEGLTDYQCLDDTGGGWMRFMEFDPDLQQISFTTYSPLFDAWRTNSTGQFLVTFDWDERFGEVPPKITQPPASQTVPVGADTGFSVTATSTRSLEYQWQFGSVAIDGATGTALVLTDVQPTNAGGYTVVVTNVLGAVTSAVAMLTVVSPPDITITQSPTSQTASAGSNAIFTVSASGTPPLSYQWLFNGAVIDGATMTELILTEVQPTNAGRYRVAVTNSTGAVTSKVATLTVIVPGENLAPVLPPQTDRTIDELTSLFVVNTAVDKDYPPDTLTYRLVAPPTGAQIGDNGVITWTPTTAQAPSTHTFETVVTDSGSPPLSATNLFMVYVFRSDSAPRILSLELSNRVASITWGTIIGSRYTLQYKDNLRDANWYDLGPNLTATGAMTTAIDARGVRTQRFYRVVQGPGLMAEPETNIAGVVCMALWVASDYVTNGGICVLIPDRSGQNNDLTNGAAEKTWPTRQPAAVNGEDALYFHNLPQNYMTNGTLAANQPFEVVMVAAVTNNPNARYMLWCSGNERVSGPGLDVTNVTRWSLFGPWTEVCEIVSNRWVVIDTVWAGVNTTVYTNNVPGRSINPSNGGLAGLRLGTFRPDYLNAEMSCARAAIFAPPMSAQQRAGYFNQLVVKYGIVPW